jgi:hypothetical protein
VRPSRWIAIAAVGFVSGAVLASAAGQYPLTLVANAKLSSGATTVTSVVTIRLDRLMAASQRTRVLDGLKYNGYQGFMDALRPLPPIGTVETQGRRVDVRYAWESTVEKGRRLVVVADKPLFFLAGDPSKARAGYELTVVDLLFDDRGEGMGTMAGAARVKPAPDGGVVLGDFAEAPVQLTIPASHP